MIICTSSGIMAPLENIFEAKCFMNIRATSDFRPGSFAKLEALIVPRIIKAVGSGAAAVATEAKVLVPVDTGELQASIGTTVAWEGQQVNGTVQAVAPHASYVEFGTGIAGAASSGAGSGIAYSPTWKGMPAQPYMRPALDTGRPAILSAFRDEGFEV